MIKNFPLHIDIFALFIFLGAVQGLFLSYFFLSKNNRLVKANIYLGLLLLASSLLCFDILFSYTNFMFQVIYLVDATETLNLLIGPLFFLYVLSKLDESKIKNKYYHFIPAAVYFLYTLLFHVQSLESKYNSYLDQYHPNMNYVYVPGGVFEDPLYLKSIINEMTIISIAVYLCAAAIYLIRTQKHDIQKSNLKKKYRLLWIDISLMFLILSIIVFVKSYFPNDLGDYIIIIAICVFIYTISFNIIRESVFFNAVSENKKYSKSSLDEETKIKILSKINTLLEDKYHLNPSPSLPDFAKKITSNSNHVSQVINEKLGLSFLELINKHRIEEAKAMILDETLNETIEGIAYLVGFNSKSTFHAAFKKFTGKTPIEYKNQQNTQ